MQINNSSVSLRLKIIVGYVSLLIFLIIIVSLVWLEHQKMEMLNSEELLIKQKREAMNRTFEKLLDFSFSDDFLLLRDKDKFNEYRMKREIATTALNGLKRYYPSDIQHAQIDTISLLLQEKEALLLGVMNTLSDLLHSDSLFQRRIPSVALQMHTILLPDKPEKTGKRLSGFFGIFKKKEEKSVYAYQKEKTKQPSASQQITRELYSLQKEMSIQYTDYWNKLTTYSDSLQWRNTELNSQINTLIGEFEQVVIKQAEKEIEEITTSREQSFRIILFIAAIAILLIVIFYLFIHQDIRKRQEYRLKLEASDCRNRELLAARRNLILTVSHDLRVPLGTISEYAELLQDEKSPEQSKGYAMNILHASRHVIGLANNLLYYYRLEAEKEQPEKEIFHLGRTIEDAAHSFLSVAEKKGLDLVIKVIDSDILVEGDCGRLVQILNNLISNAVKFTSAGYIQVGAQYRVGKLSFFIRDTGIGIDKESQEQIFTAFERGKAPNAEEGFGLGLAITYKLVTLLEGTIHVQSTPGHGSTFEVCLPMRETNGKTDTIKTPLEGGELSGMRVLVIDDDRIQLEVIQKMYARHGVECDCCLNVSELIAALRRNRYDLMLTDMRMLEMDGYGVLALLRGSNFGQTRTLPVLAVTAQADKKPEYFRKAGFADCLYKPFSQKELVSVTSYIDRTNFAAIMEGEDNTRELLDMFIEDTEKELSEMQDALETANYMQLRHIIHKAAPLWGMIRINVPLNELEEMASLSSEKWCKELDARIKRLMKAVEQAVKKAKELKFEPDENHIGSRR
ncbi:hybrid sensor histidine kinase/response regulator [Bacteroides thetaiotaomicron]|uniref:hybrid sensor histidine kinase/response regulator n=1 Tax=Bacteroides thetaiotaomicron TaxID=818 RepID=UPI002165D244|nr:hybrid sensor histidine kinase/response regulator [Bacteroides thetaiotaomicron]MCS3196442.1 ATP-binding protein [Bacteroides thetaiotaomicron]